MIKAIIFDFGNVICRFTNDILRERISKLTGKSKEEILNLIYKNSDLPQRFETGLVTPQEFFKELSQLCGLKVSYEELKNIYSADKFTPVDGMSELIKSFQGKYKIGLLSNTSDWDHDYMIKTAPIVNSFDSITLSYEVQAMKPDLKIFYDALNKLNLSPQECIYVDDILEYVQAAESIGMNGIHFTNYDNFISSLNSTI